MDKLQLIERYTTAFDASKYRIQLKHQQTGEGYRIEYTPEQLVRAMPFLRHKNANGFNVYARPLGYQYVLLDDLEFEVLSELAKLKPCLLIETSPANYQAWLILPTIPANREIAKTICQQLATQFQADLASAEPDHLGRLPGFTNQKEKHRLPNGYFPRVYLHRAEHRLSTFYPLGGRVLHHSPISLTACPIVQTAPFSSSTSEQDFGVACGLVRAGKTDSEIFQHLLQTSPDLTTRKGKHADAYLTRTIANARKAN